jgi:maltose O-acetyltransferase
MINQVRHQTLSVNIARKMTACLRALPCLNISRYSKHHDTVEYDKMISGQLYNAGDPHLSNLRYNARKLLDSINSSALDIKDGKRLKLLGQLFGSAGKGLWLQPPFYCDYGSNITLGNNVYFNFDCVILDVAKVTIGSSVLFGPGVHIYTATHPLEWEKRKSGEEFGKPVTIKDDVWIGGGAVICPGVNIEEKSIIGAGAVVTRDVPSGVVVAGNPARVIKEL